MEAVGAAFALSSDLPNPLLSGSYHLLLGAEEGLELCGALIAVRAMVARVHLEVPADGGEPAQDPDSPRGRTSDGATSVR